MYDKILHVYQRSTLVITNAPTIYATLVVVGQQKIGIAL